jgi:SagB-type dehydrogenase family enzyme
MASPEAIQQAQPNQAARDERLARVFRYHEETKHHFQRYARALGYMDWANQPDPFRRYHGAPLLSLPLLGPDDEPRSPSYDALYDSGGIPPQPVTRETISRFFEYALSLTAWKEHGGNRWALRSNPSSGNLHPTEGYLVVGGASTLSEGPGIYHYAAKEHALERRMAGDSSRFVAMMRPFPPGSFLVGLSSVHWREAWKYGERAFRYCQHDVGHAIGTLRIAAATLGWQMLLLDGTDDETLASLLGLDRSGDYSDAEREHPDCLAVIWPTGWDSGRSDSKTRLIPLRVDRAAVQAFADAQWIGKANRLSRDNPIPWELIDDVAAATWKPESERDSERIIFPGTPAPHTSPLPPRAVQPVSAYQIIHQRRSAVALDGRTGLPAETFYRMLGRTMPGSEHPTAERSLPWDALPWEVQTHLALFVHRVEGLAPGLYLLIRDRARVAAIQTACRREFEWAVPSDCPPSLPLFRLAEGDAKRAAAQVSCHQEIAADGAFSLGMIAEFESSIRARGPWWYRRLFWETGLIGQVLYLEAEAAGVRGTGIGCFFDDPVHQILGIIDHSFQSLYHFTIGGPVEDARLKMWPPYGDCEK